MGWFFKKRDTGLDEIHSRMNSSFTRIRDDMEKVSSWINHFNEKNDNHDNQFKRLQARMDRIENSVLELQSMMYSPEKEETELKEDIKLEPEQVEEEDVAWMELTETQQKLCWKIAALQKEMPNEWISLKSLAQEMYPQKEYSSVRSTICQFVSQLEEMGFVKRRRRGRQTYVSSTEKNPYKEKAAKKVMAKARKRRL